MKQNKVFAFVLRRRDISEQIQIKNSDNEHTPKQQKLPYSPLIETKSVPLQQRKEKGFKALLSIVPHSK